MKDDIEHIKYRLSWNIEVTVESQEIGEELSKLKSKDGKLHTKAVVNAARKRSSPLHKHFEWDDNIAGDKYRIWQARHLIGAIVVIYDHTEHSGYFQLRVEHEGYRTLESVLSNEDLYQQLVAQAKTDFESYERRYKEIRELAPIFKKTRRVFATILPEEELDRPSL